MVVRFCVIWWPPVDVSSTSVSVPLADAPVFVHDALEMSADCDMQDRAMLSAVGVYVLQRAARLGYERVKYEQLREAVTSYVTGDAIRRAMDVGVKLGIYVKVGPDVWRLKRDNQLGRRVDHDPLFPGAGA